MGSEAQTSKAGKKVLLTGDYFKENPDGFEEIDGKLYGTVVEEYTESDDYAADFKVEDLGGTSWFVWDVPEEEDYFSVNSSAPVPGQDEPEPVGFLFSLSGTDYAVDVTIEEDGGDGYDVFLYEDDTLEELAGARHIAKVDMTEERLERAVAEMVEIALIPKWTGVYVAPEKMENQ